MTRGKRVVSRSAMALRHDPRVAAAKAAAMVHMRDTGAVQSRGKREEQAPVSAFPRRKNRMLVQLLVSATVLLCVVGVKLTMPDVVERYGGEVLRLMGEDTDFVAAFSAAGRAIAGEKAEQTIENLYVAVFGGDVVEEVPHTEDRTKTVYSPSTIPARVEMLQQVLGFSYMRPTVGQISSSFGYREHPVEGRERFHYGIDISAEEGTPIQAFSDGVVMVAGESTTLGKYVEVAHANGYTTLYAHCSRIHVSEGQSVRMGDPIAEVGDTGDTTGNHLHFELCCDGRYINPIYYVV